MGNWFSNIHIRRNKNTTEATVSKYISDFMSIHSYIPAESENDADGCIAILDDSNSQWISIYSDLLSLDNPESVERLARPASEAMDTDILGISCFDSDFLFLNLINANDNTNSWVGIGSAAGLGIRRRSAMPAWKNKVTDFTLFSNAAKAKYLFAEEFLSAVGGCLMLPHTHAACGYDSLKGIAPSQNVSYLFFSLQEESGLKQPTVLKPYMSSGTPCTLEYLHTVSGINTGGASKGLSVYFLGPYVENDEITFSDVSFVKWENNRPVNVPFELSKVQLSDGQWAYCYHDPGFRIAAQVDKRLPGIKRVRKEMEHNITVRFIPHGNPRKILDITVALVPDKNPDGLTSWNVWRRYGSKKAYIEFYNAQWSEIPECADMLLNEADFD